MTPPHDLPRTVGELRASGHRERGVKAEIRENLLAALAEGRDAWPGILGFEDTVLPQLERALIAGHDVVLLGERGQGKTRLLRALTGLLDEWTPVIAGAELGEHPYTPDHARSRSAAPPNSGDDLPIAWRHRSERYTEKLATPDTSVADLVGDIDPIKVAEGRSLGDPETIAYGLIPRAHRGIVAINELPDLAERIQVSMLNVMEERDIQVRGYTLRLPLDVLVVASANPEDYTNRGRIITPLKDRFGAEIRTHYPLELEAEVGVIKQEAHLAAEVPEYLLQVLARFARHLRESQFDRPALGCVGAVRDRRRRDRRRRGPAPLRRARRAGSGGAGGRPRHRDRRAARQAGVRVRRGGPRAGGARAPAAAGHRGHRAAAARRHRRRTAGDRRSRAVRRSPPVSGCRRGTCWPRCPKCPRSPRFSSASARSPTASAPPRSNWRWRRCIWPSGSTRCLAKAKPSMAKHRHGRSSRYSRYTGGPDPLAPPVDLREALEQIGQDVMEGSSPRRALSELMRRGTRNMRGADRLAAEANRRRRELLQRNNLDGTLQEIKKLLDEAVLAERKELARALDDDARFNEMRIESLPPSPAKAVQELSDYDWRSQEAREKYEQIKDLLGREMLDQRFAGMKQALENATDEDRQRVNEMLDDLNDLLDKHSRGEDTQQDFDDFMNKHGEFFPENPQNVDELLDSLAQRAAAAQRFRNSLSADQRAELDALAQQAFGSPSLMNALNRLDAHLQAARPGEDWTGSSAVLRRQPDGHGRGHAGAGRHRRARAARRGAVAELRRRHDGRRRPRHAGPPTRRRRGRRRARRWPNSSGRW